MEAKGFPSRTDAAAEGSADPESEIAASGAPRGERVFAGRATAASQGGLRYGATAALHPLVFQEGQKHSQRGSGLRRTRRRKEYGRRSVGLRRMRAACYTPRIQGTRLMDIKVKDSNGTVLSEGDTVTLIKDLKVKGSSTVLKRGTVVKNIHLTDDPDEIEGRTDKVKGLVLRTEFLKKA